MPADTVTNVIDLTRFLMKLECLWRFSGCETVEQQNTKQKKR